MSTPSRPAAKPRPVWFNLSLQHLPLPGIVSILHRASGALLFLFGIPFLLWLVQTSLGPREGFAAVRAVWASPLVKLLGLAFLWAYLHHFCAGIRYLLLDLDRGVDLPAARRSSTIVLVVSLALTLIVGARLW
jgi:succinate dehydrogenase / fumarate reductase cytochrome b subunit